MKTPCHYRDHPTFVITDHSVRRHIMLDLTAKRGQAAAAPCPGPTVARLKTYSQQADAHTTRIHHWPHQSQTDTQSARTNSFILLFSLSGCRSPQGFSPTPVAGTDHHTELARTTQAPQYSTPLQSCMCLYVSTDTCLAPGEPLTLQSLQQLARTPHCLCQLAPPVGLDLRDTRSSPTLFTHSPAGSSWMFTSSHTLPCTSTLAPVLQHR